MIKFRQKDDGVETVYVFPFSGVSTERTTVYPLQKAVIDNVTNSQYGNYRIGVLDSENNFWVRYAGRSDKNDLRGRLNDHLTEERFQDNQYFFDYSSAADEKAAYRQECLDYHRFLDEDGFFLNRIHPDRPNNTSYQCPGCGCPNY